MIYRYRMYFLNFFYKKKIPSIFYLGLSENYYCFLTLLQNQIIM